LSYTETEKILEYEVKEIVFKQVKGTAYPDGMLIPVILRFNPRRLDEIWTKLNAGVATMDYVHDDESDLYTTGTTVKELTDSIIPEDNSKDLFERSIPNSKFSELSQPPDVQRKIHDNHAKRSTIQRTSKLDLIDAMATELDAVSIRSIYNSNVGKDIGLQYISYDRPLQQYLDSSPKLIGLSDSLRASGYTGAGVNVAVLDSGIDESHPDLQGKIRLKRNFTKEGGPDDVSDATGHGTHVASTIGGKGTASNGQLKGIAPGCELLIGRVLHPQDSGLSNAIRGIKWASANSADVISMSIGSDTPKDGTDELSNAVLSAVNKYGIVVVCAAGNAGFDRDNPRRRRKSSIGTPAASQAALTVGAVKFDEKTNRFKVADFSSIGPVKRPNSNDELDDHYNIKPDIIAPGEDVLAGRARGKEAKPPRDPNKHINPQFEQYYTFKSGTSMATPIVSGSIAIILEAYKKSRNIIDDNQWKIEKLKQMEDCFNLGYFIKKIIMETAQNIDRENDDPSKVSNKSMISGAGVIRVDKALARIQAQQYQMYGFSSPGPFYRAPNPEYG
jgi:subtilisin family serine protease